MEKTTTIEEGILLRKIDRFNVLYVEGTNSRELQDRLKRAADRVGGNVGLHLQGVEDLNSGFMGCVMVLYREVIERGNVFVLVSPPRRLLKLAEATGAIGYLRIVKCEEFLENLGKRQLSEDTDLIRL